MLETIAVATGVVAAAEIGDKTQLLALCLAARFRRPLPIVLGILAATVFNHALAGVAGVVISSWLTPEVLRWVLTVSFLAMAAWMLVPDKIDEEASCGGPSRFGVFGTTTILFFLAEMGDKTQIATVAMAAHYQAALAVVIGTTLGMLVAFARMSSFKPLALLARFYISIMRGTPLMLQMFAIYFAPYYVFGIQLTPDSKWQATIAAFIVNYAAYFAEIYRSGMQSIPRGQYEAAEVLGYSRAQTFFKIVLPLLKPIISTMVILNSLAFWNDYLLPSLVLTDKELLTLPLSTYSFYGTYSADYGTIMAGLLLCVIPILALYIVLQKQIINGVVTGAVK